MAPTRYRLILFFGVLCGLAAAFAYVFQFPQLGVRESDGATVRKSESVKSVSSSLLALPGARTANPPTQSEQTAARAAERLHTTPRPDRTVAPGATEMAQSQSSSTAEVARPVGLEVSPGNTSQHPLPEIGRNVRHLFVNSDDKQHPRMVMEVQPRDVFWADVIELQLQGNLVALVQSGGFAVRSVACRSTLCEIQLVAPPGSPVDLLSLSEKLKAIAPTEAFSRIDSFTMPDADTGSTLVFAYAKRSSPK